jgi:hypothetical protein
MIVIYRQGIFIINAPYSVASMCKTSAYAAVSARKCIHCTFKPQPKNLLYNKC